MEMNFGITLRTFMMAVLLSMATQVDGAASHDNSHDNSRDSSVRPNPQLITVYDSDGVLLPDWKNCTAVSSGVSAAAFFYTAFLVFQIAGEADPAGSDYVAYAKLASCFLGGMGIFMTYATVSLLGGAYDRLDLNP